MDITIEEFHDKRSRSLVLMGVVHFVEFLSEYLEIVGYNLLSLGDLGTLFYYFTVFLKVFVYDGLGGVAVVALYLPDVLPLEVN